MIHPKQMQLLIMNCGIFKSFKMRVIQLFSRLKNIQELENVLVQNGEAPFLNDIDDVNAAMDLLNICGTGDSWLANLATQATRPALKAVREFNRRGLPQKAQNVGRQIPKYLVPLMYGGPRLIGGISND